MFHLWNIAINGNNLPILLTLVCMLVYLRERLDNIKIYYKKHSFEDIRKQCGRMRENETRWEEKEKIRWKLSDGVLYYNGTKKKRVASFEILGNIWAILESENEPT
jgi:hypothetical protein